MRIMTYELWARQIGDFKLKSHADKYLILRAGLYPKQLFQTKGNRVFSTGLDTIRLPLLQIVD